MAPYLQAAKSQSLRWSLNGRFPNGGSPTPPLSVMTPAVGSRAEKILQKKAKFLVDNLKEPDRSLHATRLETFHLQAKAPIEKWRTVRTLTDKNDLAGGGL